MRASKTNNMVALGELIELCDERNLEGMYGTQDVMGMTITKELIPTKADVTGADLKKFLVVKPNEFVYNPRTYGKRIGLGYNNTKKTFIISWNNTAFRVKDKKRLYHAYLYMYLNRIEWDRHACFRSWGSSTEVFSWSEFCLMEIPLPDIEVQRELVAVYEGLKQLAEENEAMLEPLAHACEAFIINCKKNYPTQALGEYIEEVNERNSNGIYDESRLYGVKNDGSFIHSIADKTDLDLSKYKVVSKGDFCYTLRIIIGSIALYQEETPCIVSTSYTIFRLKNEQKLLSAFLNIIFRRKEFHRYAKVNSWGSAKDNFSFADLCAVQIPIPPIEVQEKIVALYRCYEECKRIAAEAREQLKTICPALVQRGKQA